MFDVITRGEMLRDDPMLTEAALTEAAITGAAIVDGGGGECQAGVFIVDGGGEDAADTARGNSATSVTRTTRSKAKAKSAQVINDFKYSMGQIVKKKIGEEFFLGKVIDRGFHQNKRMYKIHYEDKDKEEVEENDLETHFTLFFPLPQQSPPKKKDWAC